MFVLGPTVNAFPDEVGTIPILRFAKKTGILSKQEKQDDVTGAALTADGGNKKRSVVRTKHFEEWMVNTGVYPVAHRARRHINGIFVM